MSALDDHSSRRVPAETRPRPHPSSSSNLSASEFERQSAITSSLLAHFQTSARAIEQTLQRTEALIDAAENPTAAWTQVARMVPGGEDKEREVNCMMQEAEKIAEMCKGGGDKADMVQRIDQLLDKIAQVEKTM
eukprot:GFKZ01005116.1.p2 GENE.GFKZ01005116.1~~GFKZ01005116.1.p2  ORF type:complete len:134 (-),score=21.68 GFKZ01005116.1:365-766(-)